MTTELMTTNAEIVPAVVAAQAIILTQRTPQEAIRWRDGAGRRRLAYVDHAYVTRTLNDAFGWDWDFEADNEELLFNNGVPFEIKCRGRLTVRIGSKTIVKVQFGCQPIEFKRDGSAPVSLGDAYKGAASDALKKCASLLGIALDLYDSDEPPPVQVAAARSPTAPPRPAPPASVNTPPKDPAEAERRFYARYGPVVGGENWEAVRAYLGWDEKMPAPVTVEDWIMTAEAVRRKQRQEKEAA
jgi:hypothetical protein